ncbi:hypothetical protein Tco_1304995 [Tanacetum coccineum]
MENPNHLNELNEAIPEVNLVVPEPNQVADIHDPNEMVDIPNDIDLVDYDDEDPEEDPEEEPEEDVDIELEDDAELIFPYEVEGDKTPPPGDVSSDFESEDEEIDVAPEVNVVPEVDVAPEATVGTSTQKPYAIRDFSRGLYEVYWDGECIFCTKTHLIIDGLAPWALRRDSEASRARARENEAKISILESGENATLKKRLAETETKLAWARMEHDTAERKLHESRVWNKMFYLDMVRIRAVPKPPSDDEDTERPRKKSKNSPPSGTESLLSHMDHLVTLTQVNQNGIKDELLGDFSVIETSPDVFPEDYQTSTTRKVNSGSSIIAKIDLRYGYSSTSYREEDIPITALEELVQLHNSFQVMPLY